MQPSNRFIRMPELMKILGVSRSSVWNYCKSGNFPQPHKISPRLVGWLESDVQSWIETRAKGAA